MVAAACPAAARRRSRPHAIRAPAALPVPGGRHDPRPLVRARAHGSARPVRLPARRPACRASGRAGAHRLRADEARPRRPVRPRPGSRRRDAQRRRPCVRAEGDGAAVRRDRTRSRSARSRRGRTSGRRSRRHGRQASSSSSSGRRRTRASPTSSAPAEPGSRATSPPSGSPLSTAARPVSCSPRGTRASGCRSSRRWPPGRRSSPSPIRRSSRSQATPRSSSRRGRSPTGSGGRSSSATASSRPGSSVRGRSAGRRPPRRPSASTGGARPVTRASGIVVSHGHGAELERLVPLLAPQLDELVVIANLPGSARACSAGVRVVENARPRRLAENVNLGTAATTATCVLFANPDARRRAATPSAALVAFLDARPRCGLAGPRMLLARRDAGSRRAAASRRSAARSSAARRSGGSARRSSGSATTTSSTRTSTEPVEADWLLGALPPHAPRDARRDRRLGRGLSPLRGGHRPLVPRDARRLGALVRARCARSTTTARGHRPALPVAAHAVAPARDGAIPPQAPRDAGARCERPGPKADQYARKARGLDGRRVRRRVRLPRPSGRARGVARRRRSSPATRCSTSPAATAGSASTCSRAASATAASTSSRRWSTRRAAGSATRPPSRSAT